MNKLSGNFSSKLAICLVFSLFLIPHAVFSLRMPQIQYFPLTTAYSSRLYSAESNSLIIQVSSIDLPANTDSDQFYVNCLVRIVRPQADLNYLIKLRGATNGNLILYSINDSYVTRSLQDIDPILPAVPDYQKVYQVGKNMTWKLVKFFPLLMVKENTTPMTNVIQGQLMLKNQTVDIYFSKDAGIVGVRTADELFIRPE